MKLTVDIEKRLGDFQLKTAFETKNQVFGMLGASGSGKSMTLKCIAGIERPDCGRIVLGDKVLFDSEMGIDLPPQKRKVGYLFQDYALFPHMTVLQNIMCSGVDQAEALDYARQFYLEGKESLYPYQLSGGEKQRVAMARMIASKPYFVLLDEPLSALDSHLRERLYAELMGLLEDMGGRGIFVSHSREEVYRFSGQIAIMDKGHIVEAGEKTQVFKGPKTVAGATLTGWQNIIEIDGRLVAFRGEDLLVSEKSEGALVFHCQVSRVIEDSKSVRVLFRAVRAKEVMTWVLSLQDWKRLEPRARSSKLWLEIPEDKIAILEK